MHAELCSEPTQNSAVIESDIHRDDPEDRDHDYEPAHVIHGTATYGKLQSFRISSD
jgi:hypothetical protein